MTFAPSLRLHTYAHAFNKWNKVQLKYQISNYHQIISYCASLCASFGHGTPVVIAIESGSVKTVSTQVSDGSKLNSRLTKMTVLLVHQIENGIGWLSCCSAKETSQLLPGFDICVRSSLQTKSKLHVWIRRYETPLVDVDFVS